jgi:hypothetical protein
MTGFHQKVDGLDVFGEESADIFWDRLLKWCHCYTCWLLLLSVTSASEQEHVWHHGCYIHFVWKSSTSHEDFQHRIQSLPNEWASLTQPASAMDGAQTLREGTGQYVWVSYIRNIQGHLGGVVVSVLTTGPKGHGFKPSQGNGFLRAIKICSTPSFRWEV